MNIYYYEITWTTKKDYGTLDFDIRATSKKRAIDMALKYLPPECIAINASRIK